MYKEYTILCTVCARGGSKGIAGKNKAIVAGKPLIAYTLEVARECDYFDDIIVSTDDKEIMKICADYNISAPFKRPDHLSKDDSTKVDVIKHATDWAELNWQTKYDIVVDLSVVSPLRTIEDIKNSVELLISENAENIFSVSPPYRNPYYNMVENVDGKIKLVREPLNKLSMRQNAPVVYDMNDSIYVWWKKSLFENNSIFNDTTKVYVMPRHRGVDIDDPFDLLVVSLMLENWEKVYFNLGYNDYWQKRVSTNNSRIDPSATDDVFAYFFNISLSNLKPTPKLLDVGCGHGRFIPTYLDCCKSTIYGIDISKEAIDDSQKRYGNVVEELKVCAAEKITYPDNYFDMVNIWATLDAVRQDKAIYEALRVLKKHGIMILTGKNDAYHDDDENALIAEKKAREKKHPNYFTDYASMKQYISRNGGKVLKEFFFERRGDFGNLLYKTEQPKLFYEWCIILEKDSDTPSIQESCQFYDVFSKNSLREINNV